jgi:regulatory protein
VSAAEPPARTETERAVDLAYQALARRDRTVAELRAFLERKRAAPAAIEAAVKALQEAGYLDDERYARRFTHDKRELERWGTERIARDLHRRGIPAELVERAVAGHRPHDEIEAALSLLADRLPAPPRDDRERDRAWRLLLRRGYRPELAYEAVRMHERAGEDRHAA